MKLVYILIINLISRIKKVIRDTYLFYLLSKTHIVDYKDINEIHYLGEFNDIKYYAWRNVSKFGSRIILLRYFKHKIYFVRRIYRSVICM